MRELMETPGNEGDYGVALAQRRPQIEALTSTFVDTIPRFGGPVLAGVAKEAQVRA